MIGRFLRWLNIDSERETAFRLHTRALYYLLEIGEGIVIKDINGERFIVSKMKLSNGSVVITNTKVNEEIDPYHEMVEGNFLKHEKELKE